ETDDRNLIEERLFEGLQNQTLPLSEAVRLMRQAMGMTAEQYAELVRVNKRYLMAIELNEGRSVSVDVLEAIGAPYGLALGFMEPRSERWKQDVAERQQRRLEARERAEASRAPARAAALAKRAAGRAKTNTKQKP